MFHRYLDICKVDEDQRMVWGYATTPALDCDGERVSLAAVKAALPDYMSWGNIREMHQPSAVGVAKEASVDSKGLWLGAHVVDDGAWAKVKQKVYKGFSIGGRALNKSGDTIEELQLLEISLVDRPANPECRIEVFKSAGDPAPQGRLVKSSEVQPPALPDDEISPADLGVFAKVARFFGATLSIGKGAAAVAPQTETPPAPEPGTAGSESQPSASGAAAEVDKAAAATDAEGWDAIEKSIYSARSLLDTFGTLSYVHRDLKSEARYEGGDEGDVKMGNKARDLARQVGALAMEIIGHEIGELDDPKADGPTFAYGAGLNDSGDTLKMNVLKRRSAKGCFDTAVSSINKAADGHEDATNALTAMSAVFSKFAKAAKDKKEMSKEDMEEAAGCMKKAAEALVKVGDGLVHADFSLRKMGEALGPGDSGSGWEAPPGIKDLSQQAMTEGSVPDNDPTKPYTGKFAGMSPEAIEKFVEAETRAAVAEARAEALSKMPALSNTRMPAFDINKAVQGMTGGGSDRDPRTLLLDGVELRDGDPDSRAKAAGKMLGNMIANPDVFAKNPITDPNFRGGAGL